MEGELMHRNDLSPWAVETVLHGIDDMRPETAINVRMKHFRDFMAMDCLEVLPVGSNKGAALGVLSTHLGFTLQDCMAFGDAMNDREMLSAVGVSPLLTAAWRCP